MYLLPEVLLVVLCGMMAGAEDLVDIARSARRKLDFLRRTHAGLPGNPPAGAV